MSPETAYHETSPDTIDQQKTQYQEDCKNLFSRHLRNSIKIEGKNNVHDIACRMLDYLDETENDPSEKISPVRVMQKIVDPEDKSLLGLTFGIEVPYEQFPYINRFERLPATESPNFVEDIRYGSYRGREITYSLNEEGEEIALLPVQIYIDKMFQGISDIGGTENIGERILQAIWDEKIYREEKELLEKYLEEVRESLVEKFFFIYGPREQDDDIRLQSEIPDLDLRGAAKEIEDHVIGNFNRNTNQFNIRPEGYSEANLWSIETVNPIEDPDIIEIEIVINDKFKQFSSIIEREDYDLLGESEDSFLVPIGIYRDDYIYYIQHQFKDVKEILENAEIDPEIILKRFKNDVSNNLGDIILDWSSALQYNIRGLIPEGKTEEQEQDEEKKKALEKLEKGSRFYISPWNSFKYEIKNIRKTEEIGIETQYYIEVRISPEGIEKIFNLTTDKEIEDGFTYTFELEDPFHMDDELDINDFIRVVLQNEPLQEE
jgi:hypothetical protein